MPEAGALDLIVTDWARHARELSAVRRAVFVEEQGIAEADEWDEADTAAIHVLVSLNRDPVGTGRLLTTGKIGRLAVLGRARRGGIGSLVLQRLVELGRARGLDGVYLHAQTTALEFYAAHGFIAEGPEFDEAGIRHRRMRLAFSAEQRPDPASDGGPHAARQR
jgi:predicted GNAT family N-acyltransferase